MFIYLSFHEQTNYKKKNSNISDSWNSWFPIHWSVKPWRSLVLYQPLIIWAPIIDVPKNTDVQIDLDQPLPIKIHDGGKYANAQDSNAYNFCYS